tara:strand:+ start:153 stop:506 length:354 start_codon:yes stop_codon:yes gene_type:complete
VSKKIQREPDGRFKKGHSANLKGRGSTSLGKKLREDPRSPKVWDKIFGAALDDKDPRQPIAWKLLADRTAPSLKATKVEVSDQATVPIIMIPAPKEDGAEVGYSESPIPIDTIEAEA